MTRFVTGLACTLGALGAALPTQAQTPPAITRPTLVVLITVDQFRNDYLERFAGQLTGGLGRLSRTGAWFTNAHHEIGRAS